MLFTLSCMYHRRHSHLINNVVHFIMYVSPKTFPSHQQCCSLYHVCITEDIPISSTMLFTLSCMYHRRHSHLINNVVHFIMYVSPKTFPSHQQCCSLYHVCITEDIPISSTMLFTLSCMYHRRHSHLINNVVHFIMYVSPKTFPSHQHCSRGGGMSICNYI